MASERVVNYLKSGFKTFRWFDGINKMDFGGLDLSGCTFIDCNLQGVCFSQCNFNNCTFQFCQLYSNNFYGANFRNCILTGSTIDMPRFHYTRGIKPIYGWPRDFYAISHDDGVKIYKGYGNLIPLYDYKDMLEKEYPIRETKHKDRNYWCYHDFDMVEKIHLKIIEKNKRSLS